MSVASVVRYLCLITPLSALTLINIKESRYAKLKIALALVIWCVYLYL